MGLHRMHCVPLMILILIGMCNYALGGCPSSLGSSECARLYADSGCGGNVKYAANGASERYTGSFWNDRISGVFVKGGCDLNLYDDMHFGHWLGTFQGYGGGTYHFLSGKNDVVSSYKCSCDTV